MFILKNKLQVCLMILISIFKKYLKNLLIKFYNNTSDHKAVERFFDLEFHFYLSQNSNI